MIDIIVINILIYAKKQLDVHLLKTDILNDCTTHYLQFGLDALERGSSRNFFSDSVFWERLCLDQPFGMSF